PVVPAAPTRCWVRARRRRLAARDARRSAAAMTKAGREQIKLGGIRTARRRLDVPDFFEIALEPRQQRDFGAALQHLAPNGAPRRQYLAGELRGGFRERHDFQMIGAAMAGG